MLVAKQVDGVATGYSKGSGIERRAWRECVVSWHVVSKIIVMYNGVATYLTRASPLSSSRNSMNQEGFMDLRLESIQKMSDISLAKGSHVPDMVEHYYHCPQPYPHIPYTVLRPIASRMHNGIGVQQWGHVYVNVGV